VCEEVNRKCPAGNTTVQLSTLYTDPERQNVVLQTDRRTDGQHYDANSRSYCVQYIGSAIGMIMSSVCLSVCDDGYRG